MTTISDPSVPEVASNMTTVSDPSGPGVAQRMQARALTRDDHRAMVHS